MGCVSCFMFSHLCGCVCLCLNLKAKARKEQKYGCVSVPEVSRVRPCDGLAVRLAGRERGNGDISVQV